MEFGGISTILKTHDKQILRIIKALLDIFRLQSVSKDTATLTCLMFVMPRILKLDCVIVNIFNCTWSKKEKTYWILLTESFRVMLNRYTFWL